MTEAAILSLIMDKPELVHEMDGVNPDDFADEQHRQIYAAMLRLNAEGKPLDLALLAESLGDRIPLSLLGEIADNFVISSSFHHHKANLIEQSTRRKVKRLAVELSAAADDADLDGVLDRAESEILSLRRDTPSDFEPVDLLLDRVWREMEERLIKRGQLKGIPSGFPDVDLYTFGWQPKKLYYIAGRPAMGKTSLVLQTCAHAAKKKLPVAFFSLEMGREEVMQRIICQDAEVPSDLLQIGKISPEQTDRISRATLKYYGLPFAVVDTPALSVGAIRTISRKLQRKFGGLALIGIDYLGYIGGRAESQRILIENNSKALKALSKELAVPVVCAAQLSRSPEGRSDKRPLLSDLRDTGAIEQDADLAAFLYRDEYYEPRTDNKGQAEFIIRKNRDGKIGTVMLNWSGDFTKFTGVGGDRR